MLDDECDFVNSFVYTVIADNLSAVQFACLRIESDFDTHRHGIRIISCVRGRMNGGRHIIDFCLPQSLAGEAGRGNRHIEHFGDRSPDGSFIGDVCSQNIVCYNSPLTVGRAGKVVKPRFSGDRMAEFDCVTDGVNRFVRSLQIVVDGNSSCFADC